MGKRTLPRNEATIVKYVSIDVGDTHTYTVTTYYNNLDIDQSADKGKSFSYTIEVGASVGTNDTLIAQMIHIHQQLKYLTDLLLRNKLSQ